MLSTCYLDIDDLEPLGSFVYVQNNVPDVSILPLKLGELLQGLAGLVGIFMKMKVPLSVQVFLITGK